MNTWPNRGASGGPCGGLEAEKPEQPKQSDYVGLTQANRPPRNPVRFNVVARALFRNDLLKPIRASQLHPAILNTIQHQKAWEPHGWQLGRCGKQRQVKQMPQHSGRTLRELGRAIDDHLVVNEAELDVLCRSELLLPVEVEFQEATQRLSDGEERFSLSVLLSMRQPLND